MHLRKPAIEPTHAIRARADYATRGAGQSLLELVEPLCVLAQLNAGMQLLEAPRKPARAIRTTRYMPLQRCFQMLRLLLEQSRPLVAIRCRNALGRGRRSWGAHVCDEVGDREIDLVSDAADNRNRTFEDRACDDFLVECPEVFERTA